MRRFPAFSFLDEHNRAFFMRRIPENTLGGIGAPGIWQRRFRFSRYVGVLPPEYQRWRMVFFMTFKLLWKSQGRHLTFSWFYRIFESTFSIFVFIGNIPPVSRHWTCRQSWYYFLFLFCGLERSNRMLLLTATGAFRKPDEQGPSSSSESDFAEFVQSPVPYFAVLFKSSTHQLKKNRFDGKLKMTTCCKTNHPYLQQNRTSRAFYFILDEVMFSLLKKNCAD